MSRPKRVTIDRKLLAALYEAVDLVKDLSGDECREGRGHCTTSRSYHGPKAIDLCLPCCARDIMVSIADAAALPGDPNA